MKYLPWILAIVGGWLIATPFLLDYAGTEAAKNNDVGVGMLMVLARVKALHWLITTTRCDVSLQAMFIIEIARKDKLEP